MFRMLVVLAVRETFEVIKDLPAPEHFFESSFLNEILKLAAIFSACICVRLDHSLVGVVFLEFRVKVIARRHDNEAARFYRPLQKRKHPFKLASLHTANDEDTIYHIVPVPRVAELNRIAQQESDRRELMVAAIRAEAIQVNAVLINRGYCKPPPGEVRAVSTFTAADIENTATAATDVSHCPPYQRINDEGILEAVIFLELGMCCVRARHLFTPSRVKKREMRKETVGLNY